MYIETLWANIISEQKTDALTSELYNKCPASIRSEVDKILPQETKERILRCGAQ